MPDLTTVEAVKGWLSIPDTETDGDYALSALVSATSADFLRAIERPDFLRTSYIEQREGDGGDRMVLRHWPISAVTLVNNGGAVVPASVVPGDGGWYFDSSLDPERTNQLYLSGGTFTDAARITINYAAGYATPPADVEQAVIEWTAERYKSRPGSTLLSSRAAGGEHASFAKEDSMPPTTAACVERYKRDWPTLNRRQEDRDYRITRINRTITEATK